MARSFLIWALALCSFSVFAAAPDTLTTPSHADSLRGYLSPLRTCFDVRFYHLDVKVDPEKKFISGSNTIRFTAVRAMADMQLDLFKNMNVDSIRWTGTLLPYRRDGNAVFIHFPKPFQPGQTVIIEFYYSGNPVIARNPPWDGGFTWEKDVSGNPWIDVSCQGTGASLWWPEKDHQSDEPDSMEISVHVPRGLTAISNGRLIQTHDDGNAYTRFDWLVRNPINNYDVTLYIGKYTSFSDHFGDLTLEYYVLPNHLKQARRQFKQVSGMLGCLTRYFGPYPFPEDGYKLVESTYLGMEHQSAVAYGNDFKNGYRGTDLSGTGIGLLWDFIIVHESAHEWFGNNITTRDIADSWVHEAFATYAESLYVECRFGYEKGQLYLNGLRKTIKNDRPCIGTYGINQDGSSDIYNKGANMLNTVRHIIANDSTWFAILKGLNQHFRHQTVDGSQVIAYICEQSGKNLEPVFRQYLEFTTIPVLETHYSADGRQLMYKWKVSVADFEMPEDLWIGSVKRTVHPNSNNWTTLILPSGIGKNQVRPDTLNYYINVQPGS